MATSTRTIESPRDSYTTFPDSVALSAAPSSSEDNTFSILPRYLLQKVKDTFSPASSTGSGETSRTRGYDGAPRSRQTSHDRPPSVRRSHRLDTGATAVRRPASPALHGRNSQLASIQETSQPPSSVGSRSPRLSTASLSRRTTALPVVSRDTLSIASGQMTTNAAAAGLSQSISSTLHAFPEPADVLSPPPPYSSGRASFDDHIPDDAQSVSSMGTLAVAQVFKKLQGETLNREYWWVLCLESTSGLTDQRISGSTSPLSQSATPVMYPSRLSIGNTVRLVRPGTMRY